RQGDHDFQLVAGVEGRKDQVDVQQTPLFLDEFAEVRIPLGQPGAGEKLDWERSFFGCPGATKGCGALGEKQHRLEDYLPVFQVNVGSQHTQPDVHLERAVLKHFVSKQQVAEAKVR